MLLCKGKQIVSLPGGCGDGLLNQEIDAGGEQGHSHSMMRRGGHADGCRVYTDFSAGAGVQAGANGRVDGDLPLLNQRGGVGRLRLNDGSQPDELGALFEIAIDTEMVAAEGSCATDGDAENGITHRRAALARILPARNGI